MTWDVGVLAPPDRQLGESATYHLRRHRERRRCAFRLEVGRAGKPPEDLGERVLGVGGDLTVQRPHFGDAGGLSEEHSRGIRVGLHGGVLEAPETRPSTS
jgi:hypothetical protein